MPPSTHGYRSTIAAASLVLGPLLMSVGDLFHPQESLDAATQAAIILEQPSQWYAAHLLLFVGLLLFIPGVLALAELTGERRPAAGYWARILLLIGAASFSAIFVGEMLIGRYIADGAEISAATALFESFESAFVVGVVIVGGFAFFAGVAVFTATLARADGPTRWPAVAFAIGTLLILAEIVTARVLLSQIGNVVILAASAAFAWRTQMSGGRHQHAT